MSHLLTVHDPRGYAPLVTGKRLAPQNVVAIDHLVGKRRAWTHSKAN